MRRNSETRILAGNHSDAFIGRGVEFDRLLSHAAQRETRGLVLLAAPSAGTSELLRQVYDRLFSSQDEIIPFYFEMRESDRTAQNAALRFLCEFLLQTVAFRRRDARIIDFSPEIAEIAELAVPSDGYWIDRLVETYHGDSKLTDDRSFARNCFSAPLRAAANDAPAFVMIDDLHIGTRLAGGEAMIEELKDIFSRSSVPFVFAGQRRFLFARMPFDTMTVEPFSFADAGKFVEHLAVETGVAVNDQTRDLIAVQMAGNAGQINSLFAAAAAGGRSLNSFEAVEQIYTDEIFGGRTGKYFDSVLDRILPEASAQTPILKLLTENMAARDGKVPVAYWKKHAGLTAAEFDAVLDDLNYNEIVSVGSGGVEIDIANIVLTDYIRARARLEVGGETRALAVGETLAENVKRAPQLMARYYRRRASIGLRELIRSFDGQMISPSLLDYRRFEEEFKGAADDKILKAVTEDNTKISLPKIVYTANTAAFYPRLGDLCDAERSAVGLGFSDDAEKVETAWIGAEIDSKLEATREITEFWCDRLEMAALSCNFANYRIWLVAPEGFAPDALDILRDRNAYGSSRKQVSLLAAVLNIETHAGDEKAGDEYEIVVPMGEDTEMIAAHTIEEIARRHHFPAKAINQIKTALVEACINASEHSLSPDKKIYQRFAVDDDKLTITISNRGLRLADKNTKEIAPEDGRRGWGLKLMKGLMDDVRIEQTDDGSRITMVKYLHHSDTLKASGS